MAFTVNDVQDLVRLLSEHPEWRAQLRPLILGDEFDRLPAIVQELAEAQRRTEARVEELAEAQRRTEARVDALAKIVEKLSAEVSELGAIVRNLTTAVSGMSDRVDEYVGPMYELLFARKAGALFGPWLRRPRVIGVEDLDRVDDAEQSGELTGLELERVRALDLIVIGGDKAASGYPETYFAVEISRTIDSDDIQRAEERAGLLRRLGYSTRPAVGGREIRPKAQALADERGVVVRLVNQVVQAG